MTKLESGAIVPNAAPHDLSEIVGSALRRASKILAHHKVELELGADLPMLQLDAVLFEQVLFNLLDNAAKYAPGRHRLSVFRDGKKPNRSISRYWTKATVSLRKISSGYSTSSIEPRKRTTFAPAPGSDWRSRAASSRPCMAPSLQAIAPIARALCLRSACRSRWNRKYWTPRHDGCPAQNPDRRRRAANPQAPADGADDAGLPDSRSAERQDCAGASRQGTGPDHSRPRPAGHSGPRAFAHDPCAKRERPHRGPVQPGR